MRMYTNPEKFASPAKSLINRLYRIQRANCGAEILEFALVVPLLLMLLIGIVWVGRAYNVYESITRACREGTRYAVLPSSVANGNVPPDPLLSGCSSDTNTYNKYVVPALEADGLNPKQVKGYCQKTDWLNTSEQGQCGVVISFSYPVQFDIPFTTLRMTTIDIPAQAQMRLENQPMDGTCPPSTSP